MTPINSRIYPECTWVMSFKGNILTTNTATTDLRHGHSAILHIGTNDGDGPPTDPSYTGSTTEAEVPSKEVPLRRSDPTLHIASNYDLGVEDWAQHKRVGWNDQIRSARHPFNGKRVAGGAYYTCGAIDHQVSNGRYITLPMKAQARQGVMEAPPKRAACVPSITYYIVRIPHPRR